MRDDISHPVRVRVLSLHSTEITADAILQLISLTRDEVQFQFHFVLISSFPPHWYSFDNYFLQLQCNSSRTNFLFFIGANLFLSMFDKLFFCFFYLLFCRICCFKFNPFFKKSRPFVFLILWKKFLFLGIRNCQCPCQHFLFNILLSRFNLQFLCWSKD